MSSSLTTRPKTQHPHSSVSAGLVSALERVPDPRDPRGVRYRLAAVLAVAISAVVTGAKSFAAIGEFAADLAMDQLERLGLDHAPEESTIRKLFARLDAAGLDAALAVWAWCRVRDIGGRRVIAIDGKTVRGARSKITAAPHLIAALDHDSGVVLGQNQVEDKSNEIPAVRDLLAGFTPADLGGSVITVDAMHTQDDTAQTILAAGADYVFTVKANRRKLLDTFKQLPWKTVPVGSRGTEKSRGRRATRTIKVIQKSDLPDWPEFPGVAQVAQLRRTVIKNGKKTVEVVYIITSASHETAPPDVLASWIQDHWGIENKLHWVRDVTFDEDRSQVRTRSSPRVMASLRNTAISLLRLSDHTNIAAALRTHARHPDQAITCILTS